MINVIIYLGFVLLNIALAYQNDYVRRQRIRHKITKQIEHFSYALGYCALCAIPYIWIRDWKFILSLVFLHGSVFPVAFNYAKGTPVFYLSKTTKAIFDRIQISLGFKTSEVFNIGCQIISIIFLILSL